MTMSNDESALSRGSCSPESGAWTDNGSCEFSSRRVNPTIEDLVAPNAM
jgi:hypothetical protein